MRYGFLLPILAFCATPLFGALALVAEPTPEEKAASDFSKGLSNPDRAKRIAAVEAFVATKPATTSAFQLLYRAVSSDPDSEVQLIAYRALAKAPAPNNTVARMLVAAFDALKPNDAKARILYAKAMEPSEFKADVAGALADEVTKLRWPENPRGYKGRAATQKQKDDTKEKQDEMKEMLEAFNAIANSSVTAADKDTSTKMKAWWSANEAKFQKADAELAAKYGKADADAAKAARDAAEAAKAGKK